MPVLPEGSGSQPATGLQSSSERVELFCKVRAWRVGPGRLKVTSPKVLRTGCSCFSGAPGAKPRAHEMPSCWPSASASAVKEIAVPARGALVVAHS